jgi:hypothetical protein
LSRRRRHDDDDDDDDDDDGDDEMERCDRDENERGEWSMNAGAGICRTKLHLASVRLPEQNDGGGEEEIPKRRR